MNQSSRDIVKSRAVFVLEQLQNNSSRLHYFHSILIVKALVSIGTYFDCRFQKKKKKYNNKQNYKLIHAGFLAYKIKCLISMIQKTKIRNLKRVKKKIYDVNPNKMHLNYYQSFILSCQPYIFYFCVMTFYCQVLISRNSH